MKTKTIVLAMCVMMVLCLLPATALAANATIGSGDSPYNLAGHLHADGDTITISNGSSVTLVGDPGTTYHNFKIVCGSNINLTLSNVNIDDSANSGVCPLAFTSTGNTLTLLGDSTLKGGSGKPGVQVADSAALKFTSGSTGSLKVYGGEDAAGIGGGTGEAGGNITIEGGNIEAHVEGEGAGIGGGLNGNGGTITISGGTVTATVVLYGAGIGGGRYASAGTITISGGTVIATGGKHGSAGIGCGTNGTGTNSITITGGTIAAAGGSAADDIGNGVAGSSVTTLSISGSADVFLKNDICVAPSTSTHKHCSVTNITGGKAYGIDTPSGWVSPFGAWLIVNTVKYDANGGSGTINDFIQRTGTTGALSDGSGFSLQYYHFTGWNTATGGIGTSYAGGADYNFSADAKLYAQWAINNYTVKYDANGGTGTTADSNHTCNTAKTLTPNGFTRTGYTYAGWAATSGGAAAYSDGQSVTNLSSTDKDTVTLYAKWTANKYTVKYDANGGTGTTADSSHTYDIAKALTANSFTRTGYTFAGWAATSGGAAVYSDGQSVTNLSSTDKDTVTLYAKWTPQYTVTFDVNNGSAVPSQTVTTGGKITKPTDPTRGGYFFDGWYTDSGLNTAYDFRAAVTADITLHAKWTKLTITSSVSDGTIYTGGRIILTPSRDGGQWSFDTNYLSCEGNTFKGLKSGEVIVTYTVNGVSAAYDVTIKDSTLPSTGQDATPIYIIAGIGFLALAAGMIVGIRKRVAFKNK